MKSLLLGAAIFAAAQATASAPPSGRYKVVTDQLQKLHSLYPQTTHLFSIGDNDDGVAIMAMRVSTAPTNIDPGKIAHLVVSTHHGNELKAPDFTMTWLRQLLEKFHSSELYRGQLADTEWTVVPVLNVSGYNSNNRYEKGQDPNRDYPGPCVNGGGGRLKSIRLLMALTETRQFVGSLTVHGYAGALTYPWGVNVPDTHTHDHNAFEQITAKAAQANGYRYGTSTDIVYPCDGSFEDWAYWKHGLWSLLLELANGNASDIERTSTAIFTYFDGLDSSPSTSHALTQNCRSAGRLDLGTE